MVQRAFEVGLIAQRADDLHGQLIAVRLEQLFALIGTLDFLARFFGRQPGDLHRGVGAGQFDGAVGQHQLIAVELAGRGEVQADLITGLDAVGIRAAGTDVEDHVQHILWPQSLLDLGHVGGLGVGRCGREDLYRHLGFSRIAGATCERQQQQDKHFGVHGVILFLVAYRFLYSHLGM